MVELWGVECENFWINQCYEKTAVLGINPYVAKTLNIQGEFGQYFCCWCPGSLCHQDISSHLDITYTGQTSPCLN